MADEKKIPTCADCNAPIKVCLGGTAHHWTVLSRCMCGQMPRSGPSDVQHAIHEHHASQRFAPEKASATVRRRLQALAKKLDRPLTRKEREEVTGK